MKRGKGCRISSGSSSAKFWGSSATRGPSVSFRFVGKPVAATVRRLNLLLILTANVNSLNYFYKHYSESATAIPSFHVHSLFILSQKFLIHTIQLLPPPRTSQFQSTTIFSSPSSTSPSMNHKPLAPNINATQLSIGYAVCVITRSPNHDKVKQENTRQVQQQQSLSPKGQEHCMRSSYQHCRVSLL